jgi:hypothetical protein
MIFNLLEKSMSELKIAKYTKDDTRDDFTSRLRNAQQSIHLFGLNFPNYFTTPKHRIRDALQHLEDNKKEIDVFIYIPSLKIRDKISELNIYPKEQDPKQLRFNIDNIIDYANKCKYIKIEIIEYNDLYKIGLSAIDLGTEKAFLHLSQVKENEMIKDAEYFDLEYTEEFMPLFDGIDELLKRTRE